MIDCNKCIHKDVCKHEDKVEDYLNQYENMKKISSLFDGEPNCPTFVSKKLSDDSSSKDRIIEELQRLTSVQSKTISNLSKQVHKYARQVSELLINNLHNTDKETTVTKDDLNNNPYKYNIPKYERPKMYKCEGGKEDKIYYSPIDKELVDEILKLMGFER